MGTMYWHVEYDDDFDYVRFVEDLSNGRIKSLKGCDIREMPYPVYALRDEFVKTIKEHGFTGFLQVVPTTEALMSPQFTSPEADAIFCDFLDEIGIGEELIVIDPYFFPKFPSGSSRDDYVKRVVRILDRYRPKLRDLRVVTARRSTEQSSIQTVVEALSRGRGDITVSHTTSDELHDRFWLSRQSGKGILSGTSFNGFGKKYCVVDFLDEQDVRDIVSEFEKSALI